jgi:tetratricopeptide (TPR) repeat protein
MFGLFRKKKAAPGDPTRAVLNGDFEAALRLYREELRKAPQKAATLHKRIAETLIQAGRAEEAIEAYLAAGRAYEAQDRMLQALALYKAALRIDPTHRAAKQQLEQFALPEPEAPTPALPTVQRSKAAPLRTKPQKNVPLFSEFHSEELAGIIDCMQLHRFNSGHVVFTQGDEGDSLFIVAQGEVALTVASAGGQPVELERIQDGGFFGEVSALGQSPRNVTATTTRKTELFELGRDYLEALAIANPHIWEVLESFQKNRVMPVGI